MFYTPASIACNGGRESRLGRAGRQLPDCSSGRNVMLSPDSSKSFPVQQGSRFGMVGCVGF
jgi:hypothetical protein